MIKGLRFKNKKAAAFGSYGWSGEGNKIITKEMEAAGFEIINDGIQSAMESRYGSIGQMCGIW